MRALYFWKNGEVLIVNDPIGSLGARRRGLTNLLCVNDFQSIDSPFMRYGLFNDELGWRPIRFANFPSEFKVHLLLLGISA
jgi:hypothetical protein